MKKRKALSLSLSPFGSHQDQREGRRGKGGLNVSLPLFHPFPSLQIKLHIVLLVLGSNRGGRGGGGGGGGRGGFLPLANSGVGRLPTCLLYHHVVVSLSKLGLPPPPLPTGTPSLSLSLSLLLQEGLIKNMVSNCILTSSASSRVSPICWTKCPPQTFAHSFLSSFLPNEFCISFVRLEIGMHLFLLLLLPWAQ